MNILLTIGSLLIIGYTAGWLLDKIGLPKIIGYIATGIALSPNSFEIIDQSMIASTQPLMEVCLAFIAFEVGGALKLSKIKKHGKEIISITFLASILPLILVAAGIFTFGLLFTSVIPLGPAALIILALLLGALACPTDPTATLAVMHQYKAKGKVTDTILGVAALDDILGILLFSLTIGVIFMFTGGETEVFGSSILNSLYQIVVAILIGVFLGAVIDLINRLFPIEGEGRWIVIILSTIIFCVGISQTLHVDVLLCSMTMGVWVVNKCKQQAVIFRILQRYTEDLIFLLFFLLSGLYLDISTIPEASALIFVFILMRTAGKYLGTGIGAKMVGADRSIQKYAAGGLLPQGGIVIGLVLSLFQYEQFKELSEILLTTIMGTTIFYELIGPIAAKRSLLKAGEINEKSTTQNVNGSSV